MNKLKPTLQVSNLSIAFNDTNVIHNISFAIHPNTILGVVGESGSGKSVTSLAIMGLLPKGISKITNGNIQFNGIDITSFSDKDFQQIRGNEIAMIFQEPMSALNPSMRCGDQVVEIIKTHTQSSSAEAKKQTLELFKKVKLPNIERVFKAYPHELSGGQKQRIVIAIAIACKPKLLIADEPTTALDVIQRKSDGATTYKIVI